MTKSVSTFLMFTGRCEEAITFYVSLISNSAIEGITKWGAGGPGKEGSVMRAAFTLNGVEYLATDSPAVHAFDFTPSMSIFVECDSEAELDRIFAALSEGGNADAARQLRLLEKIRLVQRPLRRIVAAEFQLRGCRWRA